MKIVVFGLTISSSWGNGHATLWRGLCRALAARSHRVVFFERDTDYYRNARDLHEVEGGRLVLYSSWESIRQDAEAELAHADAVIVTSYCPDGADASELALEKARGSKVFYDLDTPVTLAALEAGEHPPYVCRQGLSGFDLVLSFTGGRALHLLREKLGARRVAALYGHVDPDVHRPAAEEARFRSSLSYLGTYSADRQEAVEELFLIPARSAPDARFTLGGSQYPSTLELPPNVVHYPHLPPSDHPAFFCSSRMTLNVTRSTMARLGYCPSGRLFEAAACGVPILSDWFEGLELFFEADREILVARTREDVARALATSDPELATLAARARERVLDEHRSERRAEELIALLETAAGTPDRKLSSRGAASPELRAGTEA